MTDKPIRFLVNTHWHGDHTGGNENMAGEGNILVAHDNVRTRMSTEQFIAAFNSKVPASPKAALPVITFGDGVAFYNGDEQIHTRANSIHMGDTFFNGRFRSSICPAGVPTRESSRR